VKYDVAAPQLALMPQLMRLLSSRRWVVRSCLQPRATTQPYCTTTSVSSLCERPLCLALGLQRCARKLHVPGSWVESTEQTMETLSEIFSMVTGKKTRPMGCQYEVRVREQPSLEVAPTTLQMVLLI